MGCDDQGGAGWGGGEVTPWRPIWDAPGPVQDYARQANTDGYGVIGRAEHGRLTVIAVAFAPSGYWHDALWCEWVLPVVVAWGKGA